MLSFLLAWNPRRAPWSKRDSMYKGFRAGERVTSSWGARSKAISAGDQLFLMRLGVPPKGLIARAFALGESYKHPHWDPQQRSQGKTTRRVDFEVEEMLDARWHKCTSP
jgi:hypothetical protein